MRKLLFIFLLIPFCAKAQFKTDPILMDTTHHIFLFTDSAIGKPVKMSSLAVKQAIQASMLTKTNYTTLSNRIAADSIRSGSTGIGCTVSIVGNNQDGIITLSVNITNAVGDIADVTMSGGFAYPTLCTPILMVNNSTSNYPAVLSLINMSSTSTGFSVNIPAPGLSLGTYVWNYHNGGI